MKPFRDRKQVGGNGGIALMEHAPFFPEIAEGPKGVAAFWTHADDGVRLRIGLWRSKDASKGTVFLFPGRTEYIELQGRTACAFEGHGFSVFTIDWRGHGLSDRVTADPNTLHVHRYDDYQTDVAAMIIAADGLSLPKPWFLLGNSMGGCIGLRALVEGISFSACAFTAPMWGIKMTRVQRLISMPVTWAACSLGMGHRYIPGHDGKNYALNNPFDGNRITYDKENYGYWVNQAQTKPELQTAGSSMNWLLQSLQECRSLSRLTSPDTPCVTFWGDRDMIVDVSAIQHRIDLWPNSQLEVFEDAKHALLLEVPRVRERIVSKIVGHFR